MFDIVKLDKRTQRFKEVHTIMTTFSVVVSCYIISMEYKNTLTYEVLQLNKR